MKDVMNAETVPQVEPEIGQNDIPSNALAPGGGHQVAGSNAGPLSMEMIQMMITQLNSEVCTFKSKDANTTGANSGSSISKSIGETSAFNLDDLQKKSENLKNEVLGMSGETTGNAKQPGVCVGTNKILDTGLMDNLKDTTVTLQMEIENMKKQIEFQKKFMKQQTEENASLTSAPPASFDDVKASVDLLKEQMEAISDQPIAEIHPDEPEEQQGEAKEDAQKTEESKEQTGQDAHTNGDNSDIQNSKKENSSGAKPPGKNAKARDDLLKKYLLLKVVKDNLGILNAKMNKILAAKGITPANTTVLQVRQPESDQTEMASVESDVVKTEAKGIEQTPKPEAVKNDEYFMYNDDEQDGELYEEEAEEVPTNKDRADVCNDDTKGKTDVLPSAEIDTEAGEHQDQTDTSNKDCSDADQTESNVTTVPQQTRNEPLYESSALADAEAFLSNYKKKATVEKGTMEDSSTSVEQSSRVRTHALLLKLQKKMADMQLQISKLQDHVRSTNAALQIIFDHEFSDL